MAAVELTGITKAFGSDVTALGGIDLAVGDGELVVLLGPSGCGKSTLLRIVAGLEKPTAGIVSIGGRVVNDVAGKRRDVAMVFQNYALYPQMTVAENMAFPLRSRKRPKDVIKSRVAEVSKLLEIEELLGRKPAELSGGQQQRVAMARALVRRPAVLLMDEPLSNLDARLRDQTRKEIRRLQRTAGVTTIYVTHDQTEALTLADRVVVMRGGEIYQVAPPAELYRRPANAFVASFIGSPPRSLVPGTLRDGVLAVGGTALRIAPPSPATPNAPQSHGSPESHGSPGSPHAPESQGPPSSPHTPESQESPGSPHAPESRGSPKSPSAPESRGSRGAPAAAAEEVMVAIRPEAASLDVPGSRRVADRLTFEVEVDLCEPLGSETLLEVVPTASRRSDQSSLIRAKVSATDAPEVGTTLSLSVPLAGIEVFDKRNGHLIWRKDRS